MKLYSNGLDVDPMVIVEVPLVESIFSTCSLVYFITKTDFSLYGYLIG